MNNAQHKRFESLYRKHVSALRRQGKADSTIELYSRAIRRISEYFDCPPDRFSQEQLEVYFEAFVISHSWETVKVHRNGIQFFYKHVLKQEWDWLEIVKPPQKKTLPDVLTLRELERVLNGTRERRYQTFILVCFSMGLRLGEALSIQVRDIDAEQGLLHVRQAKGNKDRYVILPEVTLTALRDYWRCHRNPTWLFPSGKTPENQYSAEAHMDRGGTQRSFKAIITSVGINKDVSIHTLRHCYGTLLTDAGVGLRSIQEQMGHECPKTTALYTQLSRYTQADTDKRINGLMAKLRINWGE